MSKSMSKKTRLCLLVILSASISAGFVAADPLTITSGSLFLLRQSDTTPFQFMGNGFNVTGDMGTDTAGLEPPASCFTQPACDWSMHASLSAYPSEPSVGGTFQLGGEEFNIKSFEFNIAAGVITPVIGGTASTPFSFTGQFVGISQSGVNRALDLSGRGSVGAFYNANDGWVDTSYHFDPVSATPEPASILLLGTAMGGLAFRRCLLRR